MNMETTIDGIIALDWKLTLLLNFDGGVMNDVLWNAFSSRLIWIPIALLFLYKLISANRRDVSKVCAVIVGLVLTVYLCDGISAEVFKPVFMRLRPSHTVELCDKLHYIGDYRGGLYGFVSSHAANSFGVFAFVSLLARRRIVTVALFLLAVCVSYSRIYLGVHFLGDVVCGAAFGTFVGFATYFATRKIYSLFHGRSESIVYVTRIIPLWNIYMRRILSIYRSMIFISAGLLFSLDAIAQSDSLKQPAKDSLMAVKDTLSHKMVNDSVEENKKEFSIVRDTITVPNEAKTMKLGDKMDKFSSSRLFNMVYVGAPLVVGGLIVKGEDKHFRRLRNDYLPTFRRHVDDYTQLAPAAVMLGLKTIGVESRSSWGRMLVSDALSTALMAGAVNVLKQTTHVTRPDGSDNKSFPSGHTATAFMTATMLTKEYGHISPLIGIGAYSVAAATGLMRMANNKHWLSDVMTGAGIGVLTTELGYYFADLMFRDKGIGHPLHDDTFSVDDNPSFLSLYLGSNIPLSGYDIDENNEFRTSSGSTAGVEGAWFLNRTFGFGGRFTVSNTSIIVNGSEAADNTFDAVSFMGGGYLSFPLSSRWNLGTKLLGGYVHYPHLRLSNLDVPSRDGIGFGTGLSATFKARDHYGLRLFADYNLMPSHSRGSGEWMNTLTVGTSFVITF